MNFKNTISKIITSLFPLILFSIGCSNIAFISEFRKSEISIDGSKQDWEGTLKYFKDEKIAVGIINDTENIYLCIATSDKSTMMKIFRTGFTVWFDPQNSDGETIGIQYPIKREIGRMNESTQKNKLGVENNNEIMTKMINKFKVEQNEILIVNSDNFPLNAYPIKNEMGIEAKIDYEMHQLIYELKVPLANNKVSNLYIDVLHDEIVTIGFESEEFEKHERGERSGMNMAGGASRGAGKAGGRNGGRKPNVGDMHQTMTPIELWIDVKLSKFK